MTQLEGASVTVYEESHYAKRNSSDSDALKYPGKTRRDGSFEVGGWAPPFRFNAVIVVEKAGYEPFVKVFRHEKIGHEATILLSPVSAGAGSPNQEPNHGKAAGSPPRTN